ncbi:hypothetical protein FXO38_34945 [Capsicum annuum]|nr:hypothetical protein FXO38_34945 [Capsicum annuum]
MEDNNPPTPTKPRVVICVGDIHGYIEKLQNLWSNLQSCIEPSDFETALNIFLGDYCDRGPNTSKVALIIFLGDYCDRGPNTSKVLDFFIDLPSKYPKQSHVFLCGNHDFAFAAFLGVLPSLPDGTEFCGTWKEYEMNEEREGWYKGKGFENMHLQGRRWAGNHSVKFNAVKGIDYKGSIYDDAPTFESYGVPHGSAGMVPFCLLVVLAFAC